MMLPSELPPEVSRRAVRPLGLPEGEWAWGKDDARLALTSLAGSIVAVFQVEVYVMPFGQPEVIHAGRSASYFYHLGELAAQFAERSRQMAGEFIETGSSDELFVLYFSGQDDAEASSGSFKVGTG